MNEQKKRRRTKGSGSIWLGKDGRWHGAVRPACGKPRYVTGNKQSEVSAKVRAILSAVDRTGHVPPSAAIPLDDLLQQWLKAKINIKRIRHTTLRSYTLTARLYLSPHIGRITLRDLTPARLTALYVELVDRGTPSASVKRTHEVLRNALGFAVKEGYLESNPCSRAEVPTHVQAAIRPLTVAESQALLKAARGDALEALYCLAIGTGMRFGELLGLQWSDINYDERTVTVRRSIQEAGGKVVVGQPKTRAAYRRVYLPAFCIEALRRHRRHLSPWVFSSENPATPLQRSNVVRRSFKRLLKVAGLPAIRFHDLRHSHATLMLANGTNIKALAERLGHSDANLTLRVYAHALQSSEQAAVNRFDEQISPEATLAENQ